MGDWKLRAESQGLVPMEDSKENENIKTAKFPHRKCLQN